MESKNSKAKKVSYKMYNVVLGNGTTFKIQEVWLNDKPVVDLAHLYASANDDTAINLGGVLVQKKNILYIEQIVEQDDDGDPIDETIGYFEEHNIPEEFRSGLTCIASQSNTLKTAEDIIKAAVTAVVAADKYVEKVLDDDDDYDDEDDEPSGVELFMYEMDEDPEVTKADIINQTLDEFPEKFLAMRVLIALCKAQGSWSPWLEEHCGKIAAAAFAFGSGFLKFKLDCAIEALGNGSSVEDEHLNLFDGVLIPYNIEKKCDISFFMDLSEALDHYIERAVTGEDMTPRSVAEQIILSACANYAVMAVETTLYDEENEHSDDSYDPIWYTFDIAENEYNKLGEFGNFYSWTESIMGTPDCIHSIFDDATGNDCGIPMENWFDNLFPLDD